MTLPFACVGAPSGAPETSWAVSSAKVRQLAIGDHVLDARV
jgi:hypothetical protein